MVLQNLRLLLEASCSPYGRYLVCRELIFVSCSSFSKHEDGDHGSLSKKGSGKPRSSAPLLGPLLLVENGLEEV